MKNTSRNKSSATGQQSKLRRGLKSTTKPKNQRAEQKITLAKTLNDSEIRYRRLFEAAQDGILILDAQTGAIDDVNPYLIHKLGYSRTEFIKKKLWEVGAFKDIDASKIAFKALQENEYIRYENLPLRAKGGQLIQVEFVSNVYLADGKLVIQCNIRDITEHKRVNDILRANEILYSRLFENMLNGFAYCKMIFEQGRPQDFIYLDVNRVHESLTGLKDVVGKKVSEVIPGIKESDPGLFELYGRVALTGKPERLETYLEALKMWFLISVYSPQKEYFVAVFDVITERKQAEAALASSEQDYRTLFENMPIGLYRTGEDGNFLDINRAMVEMFGYKDREALLAVNTVGLYVDPSSNDKFKKEIEKTGTVSNFMAEFKRPDGTTFWTEDHNHIVRDDEGKLLFYQGSLIDITRRKQSEEHIRYQASLLENVNDAIVASDAQYRITAWNAAAESLYGWKAEEVLGRDGAEIIKTEWPEADAEKMRHIIAEMGRWRGEATQVRKDGKRFPVEISSLVLRDNSGIITGYVGINREISGRKQSEERIQRQLEHLAALREIDRVIASSFDLRYNLAWILKSVTKELGVDAADVLILNPFSSQLDYGGGTGFQNKAADKVFVHPGQSHALHAVLDRQLVHIPNLKDTPHDLLITNVMADEGFVCYFGVPLITKGSVKGVLEVFHHTSLEPDQEWFDFLNTLAGQAALAIDNASLFNNLQRSNMDLSMAYDATIEGWSRAMDLRDKETEGHTQRVTEMTMELGALFGIKADGLVNVRRGALLHDIGKMGVPDGILLKAGPLTEEEWVIMKRHPTFAFDMLSPIGYLKPAMDIPYCHHEKWDGTGYPRGLKGEQIPLTARIFSVVDVWDALTSDRPYRNAWSNEKALEYLKSETGKQFDPAVLKTCLESGVFDRKD